MVIPPAYGPAPHKTKPTRGRKTAGAVALGSLVIAGAIAIWCWRRRLSGVTTTEVASASTAGERCCAYRCAAR